jgi:predicted small integral membrane protein
MAYPTDIQDDMPESKRHTRIVARERNWQLLFFLLFVIGTIIATVGWFAEWKHLQDVIKVFRYSSVIAVIGHALQVLGTFGSLITPDYVEGEREQEDAPLQ